MTLPEETATTDLPTTDLPTDVGQPADTSFPTHDSRGRPVLGIDNGTNRPRSAPLDVDGPPDQSPADQPAADVTATEALALLGGAHAAAPRTVPVLPLPAGADITAIVALSHIINRRQEQDAKWGGAENDDKHTVGEWLDLIWTYSNQARIGDRDADIDLTIDKMIDVAALGLAAVEALLRHAERLDQAIGTRLAAEADTGDLKHLEGSTVTAPAEA